MDVTHDRPDSQAALWNGTAGQAWVQLQALLDGMFEPIERVLVAEATAFGSGPVLDVGCGTGATTLAIARALGLSHDCVGVDVSAPMIAAARDRVPAQASNVSFVEADAQRHAFEPGRFRLIVSRFGVMFFDEPVEAFANLRQAATDDAQMRLIAWRSAADNPFMTAAERAVASLLPPFPTRVPEAPGQFAFADPQRVQAILAQAGWHDVSLQPLDVACTLPGRELPTYLGRLGPVGRALQDVDGDTRERVLAVARRAFEPYVHGGQVRFDAACWMIAARASVPGARQ
ncbi:class I SAM-dependent methyltransferase [Lysobacter sp.]|uniref:class I SAM-dependent methyltransferase n=1 Tax=Lysobacter sp. TaxID=72226 RepID=UPI002D38FB91|nr:class I SAM-dependent methyltransferase [Lysobacter sp.]HZX78156.1 class I SAM-dependent methyltransferase [Lysobacter sp.]